jgi:aminopeptidase N
MSADKSFQSKFPGPFILIRVYLRSSAAKFLFLLCCFAMTASAQMPPIEPGVPHELAKWRAANYSDVRYKLNLTLEKMSPVLKGTIEIRVKLGTQAPPPASPQSGEVPPIILDWRKIRGSESLSTISNISINGIPIGLQTLSTANPQDKISPPNSAQSAGSQDAATTRPPVTLIEERSEHLIFQSGVKPGENIIKLDFTSPILTSGSAITRYIDKEDGSEYLYSLFVPSDASTAFPVFDQPDLKARFSLEIDAPKDWRVVTNGDIQFEGWIDDARPPKKGKVWRFDETKPISTYIFAFAAGDFEHFPEVPPTQNELPSELPDNATEMQLYLEKLSKVDRRKGIEIYVRKSQAAKFKPHAAEVFRLNREGIKFLEQYFDYKFPFPKYDIVLIPEFPFGGMEHAGATFLREASVIFPQEPTKNDYISRANVIFHEAAHQWFGDTVTMKWFDDLWLKEGFAEFMAYKTLEKVMPEYNAWKVFYERNKQAAYLTDSTKGTTPIYQEIANLSAAKSAYGNIVYRKAPSFLKQAEFYLGPDKFQAAVRAFLKKYEFGNAGWEDLVDGFETQSNHPLDAWAKGWVKEPGVFSVRLGNKVANSPKQLYGYFTQRDISGELRCLPMKIGLYVRYSKSREVTSATTLCRQDDFNLEPVDSFAFDPKQNLGEPLFIFPNYQDYGYGIFLLDPKSRDYVLKNIQNEKDDFLRTMMWGSLWDSVREGELDPREYVELVVRNLKVETDESTIQTLLGRVSTAMRYYIDEPGRNASVNERVTVPNKPRSARGDTLVNTRVSAQGAAGPKAGTDLQSRVESLLIDRMQNAATPGQKITFYRAFLNIASSENARRILKTIFKGGNLSGSEGAPLAGGPSKGTLPTARVAASTKDKFDIVSRLIILGDPDAPKLLADLEKTETSDEAKRYAYAARAGFATPENKAKFWNDFVDNKEISESWIEAAFGPFNNVRHSELTLPYLERALKELPNHKRNRKIFFVNGWLAAFIGGQRSERALEIINKFLADNPNLDKDLRLKILENSDVIERAVKIRAKYSQKK